MWCIIINNLTLGQIIKNERVKRRLTQEQVAGDFITRNMLSKIENNLANPSIKTIEYLSKKLDISITYLLESFIAVGDSKFRDTNDLELVYEHTSFLIKNKEYNKCIKYIEDLVEFIDSNKSDAYYGKIKYNLAISYMKIDKFDESKQLFINAVDILNHNKDFYFLAKTFFNLSYIHFSQIDYLESEKSIRNALNNFQKSFIVDIFLEIRIYYRLGYILSKLNKYDEAINPLEYSLDISKEHDCFYNQGQTHMVLGVVYKNLGNMEKAIYHTKKAKLYFEFADSSELAALSYKNLGNIYLKLNNHKAAKENLLIAQSYFENINKRDMVNIIKGDIVESLVIAEEYNEALKILNTIDCINLTSSDLSSLYINISIAHLNTRNYSEAYKYLIEAERILLDSNNHKLLYKLYNVFARLYNMQEDFKSAYEYSNKSRLYI